MDRTFPSEGSNVGSIPAKSTKCKYLKTAATKG